ncbi:LacI family DNA-binding transcriptional regulator [Streptomyces europaeiscabiei]|uniref:LacI family DNA-binding transcriptional regulator n=1 Tax=Streptomyces europaeiscabiei TaxID=146819 RepID=UPI002E0EF09C|nr:LacI family DNA-binding transcriptional regulator [Streptomyces europaeiscabiei]
MNDVARLAGVSQSTVSSVVNGRTDRRIPEATQDRVLHAVRELGFRVDQHARGLRIGRTQTIGLLTDHIASSPFAGKVVLGAQDQAWKHGRLILLVNTGGRSDFEVKASAELADRRVDGFVYAAMAPRLVNTPPALHGLPTVMVNCFAAPEVSVPAIVPREVRGGLLSAQAVLEVGHRDIGYLSAEHTDWAQRLRLRGFERALRSAGVAFDPSMIIEGTYDAASGYDGVKLLMGRSRRPTAIVCANDRVATGALFGLQDLGLRVPHDVSLVGYDNDEHVADATRPELTTVALPHYEMGVAGVQALMRLIEGEAVPRQRGVPGKLLRRASVAPPSLQIPDYR